MKKKIMALLTGVLMLVCCVIPAMEKEKTTEAVDENYDRMVGEIMRGYEADPEGTKSALEELDTVLVSEPIVTEYRVPNTSKGARINSPLKYTLSVYSTKRGNSSNYHLQWRLECSVKGSDPGPLDYVSIEWDTERAKYYSSSGDGTYSSVSGKSAGIVLFNLEDDNMGSGSWALGTVYVTPTKSGNMDFGSKYTHTYIRYSEAGTATYGFGASANAEKGLGLSYTDTYTVTTTGGVEAWDLWTDNTVTMHL